MIVLKTTLFRIITLSSTLIIAAPTCAIFNNATQRFTKSSTAHLTTPTRLFSSRPLIKKVHPHHVIFLASVGFLAHKLYAVNQLEKEGKKTIEKLARHDICLIMPNPNDYTIEPINRLFLRHKIDTPFPKHGGDRPFLEIRE